MRPRFALLLFLLAFVAPSFAATDPPLEYQVKAAFLFKFGDYVDWPGSAFQTSNSPATLCILGDDPFGEALDKAIAGKHIGDRPIALRRLANVIDAPGCQILFISGKADVPEVLAAVRGMNILTVTDAAPSARAGIINFVLKDNRVRFEIDDAAASINGLGISSKLLSLAISTKPRG
jgi:hypothetical protein